MTEKINFVAAVTLVLVLATSVFAYNPYDESHYCLVCSWAANSLVKNTTCKDEKVKPAKHVPCYDPLVLSNNATDYNFLAGPCYNHSIAMSSGQACAKYSYYLGKELINVTRFAAVSAAKLECITSHLDNGYKVEVCLCRDRNFCNHAGSYIPPTLATLVLVAVTALLLR